MKNLGNNIVAETNQPRSWFDLSVVSLIISNILVAILAIKGQYDLRYLGFIYCIQVIILSTFFSIKTLLFRNNSEEFKQIVAILFVNLCFLAFLSDSGFYTDWNTLLFLGIFLANQFFSFIYNFTRDQQNIRHNSDFMQGVFFRIFPLYVIFALVSYLPARISVISAIIFYFFVRLIIDITFHVIEHDIRETTGKGEEVDEIKSCILPFAWFAFFMNALFLIINVDKSFGDTLPRGFLLASFLFEILLTIFLIGFIIRYIKSKK